VDKLKALNDQNLRKFEYKQNKFWMTWSWLQLQISKYSICNGQNFYTIFHWKSAETLKNSQHSPSPANNIEEYKSKISIEHNMQQETTSIMQILLVFSTFK